MNPFGKSTPESAATAADSGRSADAGVSGRSAGAAEVAAVTPSVASPSVSLPEPIRTLIFDWDGTLHNTKALYGASLRKTCEWIESLGYSVPEDRSDDRFSKYLGINPREMWLDFMPELPYDIREECSKRTGDENIRQIRDGKAKLYEGALEVLSSLRSQGYHLLILSNCKNAYMDAQREAFGLDRFIEEYYTSESYHYQPKEITFDDIRSHYPGNFCMIGDRASDKRVSDTYGIPFIGCLYGFGAPDELEGATAYVKSVGELVEVVQRQIC